jgi:hypothetical protein
MILGGDTLRRYKLRLGDGTLLLVDRAGLNTWLMDRMARVQTVGSSEWRTLREFLAEERAAARFAARREAKAAAALPAVPTKPLPLVYPTPKPKRTEGETPSAPVIPPPSDPVEPPSLTEPPSLRIVPEEAEQPSFIPPVVEDEAPASPTLAPPEALERVAEEAEEDQPGLEAWAEEPAVATVESIALSPDEEDIAEMPPPPVDDPLAGSGASTWSDPPEAAPDPTWLDTPEPGAALTANDAPTAPPAASWNEPPPEPVPPLWSEPSPGPAASPWHDPSPEPAASSWNDAPPEPAAPSWRDSPEPHSINESPRLQSFADDPVAPRAEKTGWRSAPEDAPAPIRLKPLDEEDEARARAAARPRVHPVERGDVFQEPPRPDTFEGKLLRWWSVLDVVFTRLVERLPRGSGRPSPPPTREPSPWRASASSPRAPVEPHSTLDVRPEVDVLAEAPLAPRGGSTRAWSTTDDGLAVIPLKPDGEARGTPTLQRLRRQASAWVDAGGAWLDRLTRRDRPSPPAALNESAASSGPGPAPRALLRALPPISELPVLRLAHTPEPEVEEDVYGGEQPFSSLWLWVKRLVLVTALVAGGILAAITWESWLPKAMELGQRAAALIHSYTRSRDEREQQTRALRDATEQLPHLAPATIALVLSTSPTSVLDPPEVFRLAYDATERGLPAMTPAEAQELEALERELRDALRPTERERLREYDRVRARRVPFAFESRGALEIVARGARALAAADRERLQSLSGQAIGAGLPRSQP